MVTHRYRSRDITGEEILFIRKLIRDHPELSRWKLSRQLCEAWQWKQANGALRDMVCRGLLLMLHRAGEIELPPVKRTVRNRIAERQRPEPVIPDNRPVRGPLASITPLEFVQVRRTPEEALFNSLMEQYHYLGYEQPVGEHLKYLVKANGQVIACLAWQSAPRHLKVRDRYIEWSEEARERNVHLLAYNTRFLILPWVQVEHLASHILGRMAKLVPQDWQRIYAHPIYWLETFVDTSRFRGTCYRAANWQVIGTTAGRGHRAPTFEQTRPVKQMLGLPLHRKFRELLMRMKRKHVDVNLEELDQIIDRGTHAPLSESEGEKLKRVLHALAGMLPHHAPRKRPRTFWNSRKRPRLKMPRSPLLIKRRDTGAMELRPTPAQRKLRFRIRSYTRATPAQAAKKAKSIRRKNLARWCASWDRRRWQQPCMSWIGCAATCAAKCSPRRNRKASEPKNTTRPRRP